MKARYQSGSVGRFVSKDPLIDSIGANLGAYGIEQGELLINPQNLNSYSYVMNNPLTYTDPLGLDAVIFYGANEGGDSGYFRDVAYQNAQQMIQGGFSEPVYVMEGTTAQQWNSGLSNVSDISYIGYYGHGDSQTLYIGESGPQGTPSIMSHSNRKDYNKNIDITVSDLNTENIRKGDIKIDLYSCNSGSQTGLLSAWGLGSYDNTIANQFSQHFNAEVKGAQGGVSFGWFSKKPYVKPWHRDFTWVNLDFDPEWKTFTNN